MQHAEGLPSLALPTVLNQLSITDVFTAWEISAIRDLVGSFNIEHCSRPSDRRQRTPPSLIDDRADIEANRMTASWSPAKRRRD